MADGERLGASFDIDVTNLKAGLAQANRLIRESQSEFKAAAAGMDDWTKSEEGLTAKIKSLNDITEIQRKKVDALQSEYDNLIAGGLDPASKAAVDLRTKINNEKAALAKNEAEIRKQEKALEDLQNASDDASEAVEDTGKAAEKASDGFTIAKGAISGFIANGLTSLVGACKNAISSVYGLADATQEYREDMGKLETAWESAGKSTELATKTYKDFYSVLGEEDRSVEAVNHLAKFVDTEQDMAKWTDICAGVWGSYGDSLPIEGLTEAANETAKVGKITGVLADALNWAGVSEDEFQASLDKCNNEQERTRLITDTLNGLYSDAAGHYKENNASVIEARKANSDYTDSMAALGEKIEPITTKVREGFNKILEKALELVEGVDFEALSGKIEKGFDTFVNDILPEIKDGLQWIIDNKDVLIAGIGGIGAAFAAFKVVSLIQGVTNAMKGMTLAQAALNLVMSLNPIGLVIAAIAGLVAIFVILWKRCDGFREFWINLWDGIKDAAKAVGEWLVSAWEGIGNFFTDMWGGIKKGASNAWEGIKSVFSNVTGWFKDKFTAAWTAVKNVFSTGGKIFTGIKEGIAETFKTVVNKIISGINTIIAFPFNTINKMLNKIRNTTFLGVSPFQKLWGENPLTVPVIPQLAKGGIVSSATMAMIGENGKEAIIPLEKNTEWIDKVADKVASKQPKSVVVNQTNNYSQAHSRFELYKTKQATAAAVRLALQGG